MDMSNGMLKPDKKEKKRIKWEVPDPKHDEELLCEIQDFVVPQDGVA